MIHANFLSIAARAPSSNGLRQGGHFQSYADLAERVVRVASGFRDRGLGPGDPVAILVPNSPDLFVIVHALFAIGAIALPLAPGATRDECLAAVRKARARALIVQQKQGALAAQVAEAADGARPLPVFISDGDGDTSLAALQGAPVASMPVLAGDTPALYMLSSGTTGLPKIVPHTHSELLADARRTSTAWNLQPDDIVFDMLPSNFAMGLLLGATNALEAGATTVYWSDPRPLVLARRGLLDTLIAERITFMGAVPAMYDALAGTPGDDRIPSIRRLFSGGAGLRRPTFDAFRARFGLPLRQAYGSTESIMVAYNDAEDIEATWASVGRPAGDAEVRLSPVETGLGDDVGELLVRSSSVMTGYLEDPIATAATFEDGWLRTGDLARLDAEGRIHIVGRSKLLIEVAGYKIDPYEVEDVIASHPDVVEAVVVGVRSSPQADQRLKAYIVPRGRVSAEQLVPWLRERLSVQKVPTLIEFRDELPKSSAGKVLRSRLSEEA